MKNYNRKIKNKLFEDLMEIFPVLKDEEKLQMKFRAFFLKKKSIVEKLDDVRLLWITPSQLDIMKLL